MKADRVGDVTTAYGYDPHGDVTELTTSTATDTLLAVELERDRLGRIVRRIETGSTARTSSRTSTPPPDGSAPSTATVSRG